MTWLVVLVAVELTIVSVYGMKAAKQRYWNILISVDQMGNAYIGGDPAETISSRAGKQANKKGWRILGRLLDLIDPGHMQKSIIKDRGKNTAWD